MGAERNGARRQDRREPGEYFFVIFVIMVFWTFVSFVVKGFKLTTESTKKKHRGHREGDRWRNRRYDCREPGLKGTRKGARNEGVRYARRV
jgi:hypothetical protein